MTAPKNRPLKPAAMTGARILALVGAFGALGATAAPAAAQAGQSYLVINNSSQTLLCATRVPKGLWQKWFELKPGGNWNGSSGSGLIEFQCRPPVSQVSYTLRPGQQYSLMQSGSEISLIEVAG